MKIAAVKAAYNHAPTMQLLLSCLFALVNDQQVHQYLICTLLWKIYHKDYLFRVSVLTTLPLQVSNFFCKHENPLPQNSEFLIDIINVSVLQVPVTNSLRQLDKIHCETLS